MTHTYFIWLRSYFSTGVNTGQPSAIYCSAFWIRSSAFSAPYTYCDRTVVFLISPLIYFIADIVSRRRCSTFSSFIPFIFNILGDSGAVHFSAWFFTLGVILYEQYCFRFFTLGTIPFRSRDGINC